MPTYHLLVSDPPHSEQWNAQAAAVQFGLVAAEMRVRANYPAPEIWAAEESEQAITAKCEALRECGLRVAHMTTDDIAGLPPAAVVKAFTFTPDAIIWSHADGDEAMPNGSMGILVSCRPKEEVKFFKGGPGAIAKGVTAGHTRAMYMRTGGPLGLAMGAVAAGMQGERDKVRDMGATVDIQGMTFLDLYVTAPDGQPARRYRLGQGQGINFSGLGDLMGSTANQNFKTLLDVLQARCAEIGVDECLMNVPSRQAAVVGIGLPKVLKAITETGQMDQLELASRLVFLTWLKGSE